VSIVGIFIGLIIALVLWRWVGGLIGALPLIIPVMTSLSRAKADPDNKAKWLTAARWRAATYCVNHVFVLLGSFVICLMAVATGLPRWLGIVVAIILFFMALPNIWDSAAYIRHPEEMPENFQA